MPTLGGHQWEQEETRDKDPPLIPRLALSFQKQGQEGSHLPSQRKPPCRCSVSPRPF